MHQIAVIKAVKKAYTFVSDIDLSTDLLFYGLFALPRKCPAPGGFDPCQCPARVDIESSRSESEKNSLSLFVREVKSEMKI